MDINALGRIPPHSVEAEQSVIGCIILDKEVIPSVAELLKKEDFYREDHKEIYDAVIELYQKAEPVDLVTVSDCLKSRGTLDNIGGMEYLAHLVNSVPTTANSRYYAGIVEEKSLLRNLIKASSEIVNMGYEASEEVSIVLDRAEKNIFDILQRRNIRGFTHVKDVLVDTFNRLEEL